MGAKSILKDIILQEITGKNMAIHAYDGIIWKIRSGYLALVFGGWAILLKSLTDGIIEKVNIIVISMFIVNLGMSFGGCFIDCNYVRRKFRVILVLDQLMESIKENHVDLNKIPDNLLKVSGDNPEMPYKCSGYKKAALVGKAVYFITAFFMAIAVFTILKFLK